MAERLRLLHVTVVGKNVAPASIEFGERLTVIHGASDTGKSHVFDLIAYAFGLAKALEMPVEAKGYQYVHLGISAESGGVKTLVRDVAGGRIGLFSGDVRDLTNEPAPEYLPAQHVSKNPRSVSRFLLSLTGLDEMAVRKNQFNETRSLEWRDVFKLAAVDEESILAKRSPIEFGQYSDRPVESAIFRLFIEGEDDSGLTTIPRPAELKRISASKVEILEQVIGELEAELAESPPADQLRDQLARLNDTLEEASRGIGLVSAKRDELVLRRSTNTAQVAAHRERAHELSSLEARFDLLRAQYDSDLSRLEMLADASDVLALEDGGRCPFCGSAAEHQHWPGAPTDSAEPATFGAAIASEQSKIRGLRDDLLRAISAIRAERQLIHERFGSLTQEIEQITSEIRRLDVEIQDPVGDLRPILEVRSHIEREIEAYSRLDKLVELRLAAGAIEKSTTSAEVPIASDDLHQFDLVAQDVLRQWSFSPDSQVHYSTGERDLVVDQRDRKSRGKGVRSILHALFNVALAEYCISRGHRHPGFVILDSPVVTYRQPGEPELSGEDETIGTNVVDAFYTYLQKDFQGQAVILENKSPVSPLPDGSREYFFGGAENRAERSGFYPASEE